MSITQCFQPPLYWQQFEDLTEGVFKVVYSDPRPTKVGRPGQAQNGVDVVGQENGKGRLIGIQCKRMDERDDNNHPVPGGTITEKLLNSEVAEARKFTPALDTWILATTAKRDANIQRYGRELNDRSRSSGSFGIQLWFWDDFVTDLNRNHDLQAWYYDTVIEVRTPDDQDNILLDLLGEAFARAAFRTPLHLETPDDFIQALKDTQCAINTGELKDRETRRVIRKAIGGRRTIANKTIRDILSVADEKLHRLRLIFQENISNDRIIKTGSMLIIPAPLQFTLNALRDETVDAINDALRHAGLQTI